FLASLLIFYYLRHRQIQRREWFRHLQRIELPGRRVSFSDTCARVSLFTPLAGSLYGRQSTLLHREVLLRVS
ncbi:MAG TPA: hypothetical protein PK922_13800, partial [Syntrophorhabdus sp.]|nr:hypothetical protein [Syntrophorhabdus sp.]